MFEASKTRAVRGKAFLETYFSGVVLDIGCGPDLVVPSAQAFDIEHGDANRILDYLRPRSFDCVHSSHCLEHMQNPREALRQWWELVRPGGYLILVVPDEDLYEQGIWPSAFNPDHKATFRLDKPVSWSPVSFEVRALVSELPGREVVDCIVQDHGYDQKLRSNASRARKTLMHRLGRHREALFSRVMQRGWPVYRLGNLLNGIEQALGKPVDQTSGQALAQIQAIVRKLPD